MSEVAIVTIERRQDLEGEKSEPPWRYDVRWSRRQDSMALSYAEASALYAELGKALLELPSWQCGRPWTHIVRWGSELGWGGCKDHVEQVAARRKAQGYAVVVSTSLPGCEGAICGWNVSKSEWGC